MQRCCSIRGDYPVILFVFFLNFHFCNTHFPELRILLHPATAACCSLFFKFVIIRQVLLRDTVSDFPSVPPKNGIRVAHQLCNLLIVRGLAGQREVSIKLDNNTPAFCLRRGIMKEITVKTNRGERVHPAARPGYHYATGPPDF